MEFTVVGHKMDPPRCPCPSLLIPVVRLLYIARNPAEVIYIIDLKLGEDYPVTGGAMWSVQH